MLQKLGCRIYAYDHTTTSESERGQNIKFFKIGLGLGEGLMSLLQLFIFNQHLEETIDYLKASKFLFQPYSYRENLVLRLGLTGHVREGLKKVEFSTSLGGQRESFSTFNFFWFQMA